MSNGTQGTKRTEWSVVLCGDEFCLHVARYRLADFRQKHLPFFLCEKCYEALSEGEKTLYKQREVPVLINKRPASGHSRGNCSGCGCNQ